MLMEMYFQFSITGLLRLSLKITGTKEITNAFSSYFASIGDRLATDVPNVSKLLLGYIYTCNSESFFLFPTKSSEIK